MPPLMWYSPAERVRKIQWCNLIYVLYVILKKLADGKRCLGAPDLIIEILSPGNTKHDTDDKFHLYEEAGVSEYWIVRPNDK